MAPRRRREHLALWSRSAGDGAQRRPLYILARHGHDPRAAIEEAVNGTRDNDTIAAIVGVDLSGSPA